MDKGEVMGNPSMEYPIDIQEASIKLNFENSDKAQKFFDWWQSCGKSLWENKDINFSKMYKGKIKASYKGKK